MRNYLILFLVTIIVGTSSCKKEDRNVTSGQLLSNWHNSNLLNNYVQTHTFKASSLCWMTSPSGVRISIPPNSLIDQSNNLVAGYVTLKFIALYHRKDLLLTNKPTVEILPTGNKALLASRGSFYLNVEKNGNKLTLNGIMKLLVSASKTGGPDYSIHRYTGEEDLLTNELVWTENLSVYGFEITPEQVFYNFVEDKFGWTSIQYPYKGPETKTTVLVKMPEKYDYSNCELFFTLDGQPYTLGTIDTYTKDGYFKEIYEKLPIGLKVHIIALSMDENGLHYAIKGATIVDGEVITMDELIPTTTAELEVLIDNLP